MNSSSGMIGDVSLTEGGGYTGELLNSENQHVVVFAPGWKMWTALNGQPRFTGDQDDILVVPLHQVKRVLMRSKR